MLKNVGDSDISEKDYDNYSEKKKDIVEKKFNFISDLDYSQEIAVKMAEEKSQLVIYGPPGTGKSQTIVNIISQYLSSGKKVLMVSQKKAALDVIYNRSSSINSKMIMFNKDIDKKEFYKSINDRIELLNYQEDNKKRIEKISDTIDENINRLISLEEILTKETEFGLTLQEMYSKPKINLEKDSVLENFFRDYRKEYPFEELKYEELKQISKALIVNKKAEKYYRLKAITGENKYALFVKEDIDIYDLEDAREQVKLLINDYDELINELETSSTYLEKSREIVLKSLDSKEEAIKINKEENYNLLEPVSTSSKFSFRYWLDLKKNKLKEEENLRLFNEKEDIILESLIKEIERINVILNRLSCINDVIRVNEVEKVKENFINKEETIRALKLINEVLRKYDEIYSLKGNVNNIKGNEIKVLEYIYSKEKNFERALEIINNLSLLSIQVHIGRLQRQYGRELENIECFNNIRKEIIEAMASKRKEIPQLINNIWDNRALDNKKYNDTLWKSMKRECSKKSRLLAIREFVDKFSEAIFELYPCWLLSPKSVSEVLPLTEGMFDVIIFDEASQMFIEAAIPTIYRGKKVIVAGDDKQLKPSSGFSAKYEEDDAEYDMESAAALEEESLLDLAKYSFDSTMLYYHYRSQYDELINFSNYAFYNGKLEVSPNISKTANGNIKPLERIKVDGKWIDRQNVEEAMKVVSIVKDILNNRKENETIGIITFNITQRELIDDMLEIEAGKDLEFGKRYYSEIDRIENNEDISLFIKNIENVQGDERDIIIFSTGYAKNEKGRMVASFGSLSQEGGENRLNVAISRAKKKIYLVTSIEPEELNVESAKNDGPKLFKKYLQYVKFTSEGNLDLAKEVLNSVCDSNVSRNEDIHYDSDFENQVHDALRDAGLIVDTQIGVSGYKIDLAVYNEKSSKYILGIECDGAAYHSSKSARERDIYRQRYLESRGWNIVRIWSKDWWNNPQKERKKILNKVKELMNENIEV